VRLTMPLTGVPHPLGLFSLEQLHLTLLDSKDTLRPELVISQAAATHSTAPGPELEALRAALVAGGAKEVMKSG
jgi:hypothetical protein